MVGPLLAFICAWLLYIAVRMGEQTSSLKIRNQVFSLLMFAYFARLALQFVLEDINVFSRNGIGLRGDSTLYEYHGMLIAEIWTSQGLIEIDPAVIPQMGNVSFPGHLFGLIIYLNGGRTLLGCVSVVALLACLTCYNLYRLALELDADQRIAFRIMALSLFAPGYVLFTSDTAKDGLVAFFATTLLSVSIRFSAQFRLSHVVVGALCTWALIYTRYYMIYFAAGPLLLGIQGIRSKSILRPLGTTMVTILAGALIATYSTTFEGVAREATDTFEGASAANVLEANANEGSGVRFDDGGNAFGALHWKLLYTLFAPFPWASGSLGFQIGKLDTVVWYYLAYRAFKTIRLRWSTDRVVILMLVGFILPAAAAYATTISNVGLIYRQRIPIVLVGYLLAALSWKRATTTSTKAISSGKKSGRELSLPAPPRVPSSAQ